MLSALASRSAVEPGAVVADGEPNTRPGRSAGRAQVGAPSRSSDGSPATYRPWWRWPSGPRRPTSRDGLEQRGRDAARPRWPRPRCPSRGPSAGPVGRRAAPRTPTAVATRSGFTNAPVGSPELVHATSRSGDARCRRRVAAAPGGRGVAHPPGQAVAVVLGQVDGRHPVEVGVTAARAGVDEHHARAIGHATASDLSTRPMRAALAHHDASGDRGGVEAAGRQKRDGPPVRPGGRDPGAVARSAPRRRRPGGHGAGEASPGRHQRPRRHAPWCRADRGDPRRAWAAVPRGAPVAGSGHHDDVGLRRAQQARSTVSTPSGVAGPATERFSTSTPSATAWSMAVTRSAEEQPSSRGVGRGPAGLVDGQAGPAGCHPEKSPAAAAGTFT